MSRKDHYHRFHPQLYGYHARRAQNQTAVAAQVQALLPMWRSLVAAVLAMAVSGFCSGLVLAYALPSVFRHQPAAAVGSYGALVGVLGALWTTYRTLRRRQQLLLASR